MKRNTFRLLAALLALALLLTLLPAVAFAEEGTGEALPEMTAKFSSNPNKRTALPLTLTEGDQLSINGVAIETVLGPKGNPLLSAGALATAAALSEGQMQALTEEQIQALTKGQIQALTAAQLQALTEGMPHIRISSDGRYISYPANPAQGAGGTALAGEVNEGLPEKEYALLLAIRKSLNNPNYSWWNVLSEVNASCEYKLFFDYLAEKWGIPAEEIRELMGTRDDDSLQIWLLDRYYPDEDSSRVNVRDLHDSRQQKKSDPALAGAVNDPESRAETEVKKRLEAYFKGRKEVQDLFNSNGQTLTLDINGQTFTIGVNGVAAGTLAPTVWQDDLTPPPYHDSSYDKVGMAEASVVTPAADLPPDGGGIDGVDD